MLVNLVRPVFLAQRKIFFAKRATLLAADFE